MMNNTSLIRIRKEYEMMKREPSDNFIAYPIEDDLFTWHFTIRGAEETEFEGGIYHGVIKLPTAYPLKPPSIMFLTPNGRFDVNVDVCLSVTKFHKEEWQAAWTIRTILEAIIAFFPIREGHDAIGAIDYPIESRKKLALLSKKWKCEICGPIVDKIPEKKVSNNNNNNNNNIIESEKEINNDNVSDISSKGKDKPEIDQKMIKKGKMKKMDLDRKSHLSNIEGIIIEDVNEYEENEEEFEKRIESKLITDVIKEDKPVNENDFGEYLRRVRSEKFAESNNENTVNIIGKNGNSTNKAEEPKIIEEVNTNKNLKSDSQNKNEINEPRQKSYYEKLQIIKQNVQEQINSELNEEIEFKETFKSIKHFDKRPLSEIVNELNKIKENFQNSELIENLLQIKNKLSKLNESRSNCRKENLQNLINVLNSIQTGEKESMKEIFSKREEALNILKAQAYQDAKEKRVFILFVVTLIILTIVVYFRPILYVLNKYIFN